MKIHKRITRGKYKGYAIRVSKKGYYALYLGNVSQTHGKYTLDEIKGALDYAKSTDFDSMYSFQDILNRFIQLNSPIAY